MKTSRVKKHDWGFVKKIRHSHCIPVIYARHMFIKSGESRICYVSPIVLQQIRKIWRNRTQWISCICHIKIPGITIFSWQIEIEPDSKWWLIESNWWIRNICRTKIYLKWFVSVILSVPQTANHNFKQTCLGKGAYWHVSNLDCFYWQMNLHQNTISLIGHMGFNSKV